MAEMVDQKLFTQEELILMTALSLRAEGWSIYALNPSEAGAIVQMVRRLALRISQLQELVEANGS